MKIIKLKKELWKEQQATRKADLKERATELKTLKPQVKVAMRELSRCIKSYNAQDRSSHNEMRWAQSSVVYNEYIKALHHQWGIQSRVDRLRKEYRCKHIIYSLYNGTPMEKIEPVMGTIEGRCKHQRDFNTDTYHYKDEIDKAIRDQKEFTETREKWLNLRRIAV